MSAFAGIYYLDTRPVALSEIEHLLEGLTRYEMNDAGMWLKGSIGLVYRHLPTTQESLGEKLSTVNRSGDLVIVADARIDNREELIEILELNKGLTAHPDDSAILLAAYKKWGEQMPEKLLGDFAFAIWDAHQNSLFCARDHFGVKPFYYFLSDEGCFFANEIKALLRLPQVNSRISEMIVADYLTGAFSDRESTVYENILRLPAGHAMVVNALGKKLHRYWSLDPSKAIHLKTDEEYAEAFRERFTEAVRCRLRDASPVGSMLSGGLDSSSITCVARNLIQASGKQPLHTFSAVFSEVEQCDERPYINRVVSQSGVKSHFVVSDQLIPLGDFESMVSHIDMPVFAPNLSLHWHLYKAAQEQGVRVLLDGFDGDTVVSHGFQYLNELASAHRWVSLMRETMALYKNLGESPWHPLKQYVQHFGLNPMVSRWYILKALQRLSRKVTRRYKKQVQNQTDKPNWMAVLNPDFVKRTNLEVGYKHWRKSQSLSARTEREGHYRTLTQGSLSLAFELYANVTSRFGIEARYPFWDKRVVEFCLALPPQQKLHRGLSRVVLRRAM
jgi:asparagine synthase (glutamine-hydrolysing)